MKRSQRRTDYQKSKTAYWLQMIESWKNSGISQVKFCEQNHLKLSTFQYWRVRLNREQRLNRLLPVKVEPQSPPTGSPASSGISFVLKERYKIQLEEQFNAHTLSKLINLLESLPCLPKI